MASPQEFRVIKSGSRTTLKDEARERLKEAEGSLSITQAAWLYAVSKTDDKWPLRPDIVRYLKADQSWVVSGISA